MTGSCWISLSVAHADCFCLQDEAMNIYQGCDSFQRADDPEPTIYCHHPHREGASVTDGHKMQKINAGEPGCSPCQQAQSAKPEVIKSKPEVPRGD
jgi:hypothetical protein